MSDRDRLIELLKQGQKDYSEKCFEETKKILYAKHTYNSKTDKVYSLWEELADYLLANGVIVPTVKVGQTVYVPSGDEETDWIDEYKVKYFYCSSKGINRYYIECGTMGNNFRPKDIGKTVFLTKEEAEQALKECVDNA